MPEWPGREPIEDALVGVCAQTPPSQSAMKLAVSTAVKHSREYKLLVHYIFKFLLACDTNEKVCGPRAIQRPFFPRPFPRVCRPSLPLYISIPSTLTKRLYFARIIFWPYYRCMFYYALPVFPFLYLCLFLTQPSHSFYLLLLPLFHILSLLHSSASCT